MEKDNLGKVKEIIADNLYMTLSVSTMDGEPWIASLYFACDQEYSFYWYSSKYSIHSQYIKENPRVAITIFDSKATGNDVDAVYIKAKAYEITGKIALVKASTIYGRKLLKTGFVKSKGQVESFIKRYQDFQGISQLRLYKAIPQKSWKLAPSAMIDGKYVDSRIEVDISC